MFGSYVRLQKVDPLQPILRLKFVPDYSILAMLIPSISDEVMYVAM